MQNNYLNNRAEYIDKIAQDLQEGDDTGAIGVGSTLGYLLAIENREKGGEEPPTYGVISKIFRSIANHLRKENA